tara:strand:- start:58 stop:387 length:330 start_codon:yes stop_codon:yes gene_type:complete
MLSDADVAKIYETYYSGNMTQKQLMKAYRISPERLLKILNKQITTGGGSVDVTVEPEPPIEDRLAIACTETIKELLEDFRSEMNKAFAKQQKQIDELNDKLTRGCRRWA